MKLLLCASNGDVRDKINKNPFFSVRPIRAELIWDGSAMSVNNEYELKCQTFGSQPSSVISWWINGDQQRKADRTEVTNYLRGVDIKKFDETATIKIIQRRKTFAQPRNAVDPHYSKFSELRISCLFFDFQSLKASKNM